LTHTTRCHARRCINANRPQILYSCGFRGVLAAKTIGDPKGIRTQCFASLAIFTRQPAALSEDSCRFPASRHDVRTLTAVFSFSRNRTLVVHDRPRFEFFCRSCRTKQDENIAETASNCACKRNCSLARMAFIYALFRVFLLLKEVG